MKLITDFATASDFFKNQTFESKQKANNTITLRDCPLSLFDKAIYLSLLTEYISGKLHITYNAINGNLMSNNLTKQRKADIKESLERMQTAYIEIECKKEAKSLHNSLNDEYKGYMIDKSAVISDNAITLNSEPVLLSYVQAKNQLTNIDLAKYFVLSNTSKRNIEIQLYLTEQSLIRQRIINTGKAANSEISFKNLYTHLGIKNRTEQSRVKAKIVKILVQWKEAGIIADYALIKKGKVYISIRLKLHRKTITTKC